MKTFFAKLVAKYLSNKIKLEDGPMDDKKKWYKSKTIWTGVVAVLLAAYSTASASFGLPPVPEWVFAILGTLGIYTRATATTKIN